MLHVKSWMLPERREQATKLLLAAASTMELAAHQETPRIHERNAFS